MALPRLLFEFVEQFANLLGFSSLQVTLLSVRVRQPIRFLHQLVVFLLQARFVIAASKHGICSLEIKVVGRDRIAKSQV